LSQILFLIFISIEHLKLTIRNDEKKLKLLHCIEKTNDRGQ